MNNLEAVLPAPPTADFGKPSDYLDHSQLINKTMGNHAATANCIKS